MFKIIGGMLVGVFLGAAMLEVIRRRKPELIREIENKARAVTDMLFDSLREAYDFREEKPLDSKTNV